MNIQKWYLPSLSFKYTQLLQAGHSLLLLLDQNVKNIQL